LHNQINPTVKMKKALFILVISSVFILVSCNKEKECMCTNVSVIEGHDEPSITKGGVKIAKGDCSDLNKVQTNEVGGTEVTTTTTCEEQ
jgi:hypothetical protein